MRRLAAVALLAASGCVATERWTASRQDYALYRDARLATDVEDKLAKSHRYLREEPDGRFRAEVKRWFDDAEPRFYLTARDRPSLLRAYLRAMPDGPNAKNARDRLEELELLRQYRLREEQRAAERVRRIDERLTLAAAERRAFIAEVLALVEAVARVDGFGAPVTKLGGVLRERVLEPPFVPQCSSRRCAAAFTRSYALPEDRELVARRAELSLVLDLERGALVRATFGGPLLFSRLAEAMDVAPVAVTDLSARVEAIGRTAQAMVNTLEPILPAAECNREAIAPRIVVRECRGVRVEVRAGVALGDFDRVEVTAAPARKAK